MTTSPLGVISISASKETLIFSLFLLSWISLFFSSTVGVSSFCLASLPQAASNSTDNAPMYYNFFIMYSYLNIPILGNRKIKVHTKKQTTIKLSVLLIDYFSSSLSFILVVQGLYILLQEMANGVMLIIYN